MYTWICCAIQETFKNLNTWYTEVLKFTESGIPICIVGNKSDLTTKKEVAAATGKDYATTIGASFIETSAKDASNVETAFLQMAEAMVKREQEQSTHLTQTHQTYERRDSGSSIAS